jgi:beta-lactam-binding protein with PASTA domain
MGDKASTFLEYIKTKTFYKHLALSSVVFGLVIVILLQFLSSFTDHDKSIEVPDFVGVKTGELDKFIEGKNVNYQIIDSIYEDNKPKGVVVEQTPEPKFKVKENRTVYVIVNAVLPSQIKVPGLKDVSLRQASAILQSCGLKLGKLTYVPDLARNAVLKQMFKGEIIQPGTFIPRGSTIDLVLGKGESDEEVSVPDLTGMTRKEALEMINLNSLIVGAEVYDTQVKDSANVFVFRQRPIANSSSTVKSGSSVDLFYTTDPSKITKDSLGINADDAYEE